VRGIAALIWEEKCAMKKQLGGRDGGREGYGQELSQQVEE